MNHSVKATHPQISTRAVLNHVVYHVLVSSISYACRNASSFCALVCHLVRRTGQFSDQLTQPLHTFFSPGSESLDCWGPRSADVPSLHVTLTIEVWRWADGELGGPSEHLTAVGPSGERISGLRNLPFPRRSVPIPRSPEPTICPRVTVLERGGVVPATRRNTRNGPSERLQLPVKLEPNRIENGRQSVTLISIDTEWASACVY